MENCWFWQLFLAFCITIPKTGFESLLDSHQLDLLFSLLNLYKTLFYIIPTGILAWEVYSGGKQPYPAFGNTDVVQQVLWLEKQLHLNQ